MLAILWLTVWATVGEAFYDDYNWYSSDDGVADAKPFESQSHVRDNFSQSLRSFAESYSSAREGDDEHTLAKVKSKLRLLRVFKLTGSSRDFEPSRGQVLPLDEGAQYCTMGRHTKVDCNYCTCVAGQLYMCTGMICPPPPGRPQFMSTCREGKKRKIDSCNYCYCRNGHEICSTRDCRLNHNEEHFYVRSRCHEGARRKVNCNRCICRGGTEYCTKKRCPPKKMPLKIDSQISSSLGPCIDGQKLRIRCRVCKCTNYRWHCSEKKNCPLYKKARKLLWPKCKEGVSRKIDACNSCYCINGRETCEDKDCEEEQGLPFYRRFRHDERQCVEGSVFKVDSCNYCICLNGTETCTSRSCSDNDDSETSLLSACKVGSLLQIDSCNYCTCPNGAYVCTNKPCSGLLPDNTNLLRRKKECVIWQSKYIKCNRCECHANRWICSRKVCDDEESETEIDKRLKEKDDSDYFYLETCSRGQKRKLDECNVCFCRNGQWLCQINDCENSITNNKKDDILLDLPALKLPVIKKSDVLNFFKNIANGFQNSVIEPFKKFIKNDTEEDDDVEPEFVEVVNALKHPIPEKDYLSAKTSEYTGNVKVDVDPKLLDNKIHSKMDNLFTLVEHEEPTLVVDDPPCKSGSKKAVDSCNYCLCRRGLWFCESKNCGPVDNLPKDCVKGQKIEIDCVPCTCLSPEKGWKCHPKRVNKKCLQHRNKLRSENHTRSFFRMNTCVEGSRRKVDACNYCICQNEAEYCTQKPCSRETISSLISSEPECLVGHPVPAQDPCNTCICHNSDILCTNNPCVLRKSEKKKTTCVGGQKNYLPDGCNYCICHGGQEFCTIRACLTQGTNVAQNGCDEGEVTDSGDNCNMCVCIKGKTVCTKKNCSGNSLRGKISDNLFSYFRKPKHKMTLSAKPKCNPDKKYLPDDFNPNCPNECICDRNELLCTNRKCYNNWDRVTTPFKGLLLGKIEKLNRVSAVVKHEHCVEFQPLPSDDPCNSCLCLNERKVCTIIACSDDNDEIDLGSDELIFKNSKFKGNKGNMMKKKNAFCEPFTFFSPDNNRFCRNCFCLHNGLALCLLNLCKYNKDIPHQSSPEELTEVCSPGERGYPTRCVSCICSEHGKWICTREDLALCHERDCDEKDEFHMGFFPYCAGCKCSIKEWFCSIQSESCRDYSNATCPLGTFIHNPRQHCSICLCGGYEEGSHNMCFTEAKCVRQVVSHLRQ